MPKSARDWFWTIAFLAFCGGSFYFGSIEADHKSIRGNEICREWKYSLWESLERVETCENLPQRERLLLSTQIARAARQIKGYCRDRDEFTFLTDSENREKMKGKTIGCRLEDKGGYQLDWVTQ
jgi:hypothetical protein